MIKPAFTLLVVAAMASTAAVAHAQQQTPQNSLQLKATGTYEGPQGNGVKFRDNETKDLWFLNLSADTKIVLEGEADFDYLRPGMTVELTGEIDETGKLVEPIAELKVITTKGRQSLGLFPPEDDPSDAKPVRDPEAGKYRVRGKLINAKEGELGISAGRLKLAGKAGEEFKVILNIENPSAAQVGDTMEVTGWYLDGGRPISGLRQGQAMAESINITLSTIPEVKRSR